MNIYKNVFPEEIIGKSQYIKKICVLGNFPTRGVRIRADLVEYKCIMDFEIWHDELPNIATRKVKRKVLFEMVRK